MRVPVYSSEQRVGAPQIQTTRVADPIDLTPAINAVEEQYGIAEKARQQAYKAYVVNQEQTTKLEIEQKYAELQDAIKNGGAYANAEKKFEDFYKKKTGQLFQNFQSDPTTATLLRTEFEGMGVRQGMKLRDAVRSRVKRDARNVMNSRLADLDLRMSNAKNYAEATLIAKEAAGIYSSGSNGNIINEAQAKEGISQFLTKSVNRYVDTNPVQFVKDYEANPSMFEGIYNVKEKVELAKRNAVQLEQKLKLELAFDELSNNASLAEQIVSGNITSETIDQNSDNPIVKSYLENKRVSGVDDFERLEVIRGLQMEMDELEAAFKPSRGKPKPSVQTEEGMEKAIEATKAFEKKVIDAYASGVFTGRQAQTYNTLLTANKQVFGDYVAPLNSEGSKQIRKVEEVANAMVDGTPMSSQDKFAAKIKFRENVEKRLGELDGDDVGFFGKNKKLKEIMNEEIGALVADQYPNLSYNPLVQESQRLLLDDGADINTVPDADIPDVDNMSEQEIDAMLESMGVTVE